MYGIHVHLSLVHLLLTNPEYTNFMLANTIRIKRCTKISFSYNCTDLFTEPVKILIMKNR